MSNKFIIICSILFVIVLVVSFINVTTDPSQIYSKQIHSNNQSSDFMERANRDFIIGF